jgi:hypothetical protein
MKTKRAKAHLSNGEVVDIHLLADEVSRWLDSVALHGIKTKDKYIPHHSISYIIIDTEEELEQNGGVEENEEYLTT